MLSKADLWDALQEYPEAKKQLIERGRQILMKDNLLDEELSKKQDLENESVQNKMKRVGGVLESLESQFESLLGDFKSTQAYLKQRVTKIENHTRLRDSDGYLLPESCLLYTSDAADE